MIDLIRTPPDHGEHVPSEREGNMVGVLLILALAGEPARYFTARRLKQEFGALEQLRRAGNKPPPQPPRLALAA